MRIALTGVSGFIGSVIARQAHEAGHTVTALVRETSRRDHVEPFVDRFVVGAQDDESAWPALLEGADAVIHNSVDWGPLRAKDLPTHGQSNLLASIRLLETSAPRPFTFMSTIAVHHDMRPHWKGVIDEDHPLRPNTEYGAYKAAVEAQLIPCPAKCQCGAARRATLVEENNLCALIASELERQKGEQHRLAGAGRADHHHMADISLMRDQPERRGAG